MIALDVARLLAEDPIAGFDWREGPGGNVFIDWHPDQPDLSVAIMSRPGQEPDDAFFGYDRARIQFIVRGPQAGQQAAYDLAVWIRDQLTGMHSVELEECTIIRAWALDSQPASIGQDEAGRPEYDLHVEIEVTRPTIWRPLS
jgi:hypothetical protein